jgi:large subunit ribosomal protein L9
MAKTKEAVKAIPKPTKKVRVRNQVPKGPHNGVQVVLLDDVLHVGKQGNIVEVKPGYARNYLIPNGLAVVPSEHNIRMLEHYKIRVEKVKEARVADLKSLSEQIVRTQSVTIEANMDDEGHLYGSVTAQDICRAMRGKNLLVEPEMIKLAEPIKVAGIHPDIEIALGYDIHAKIEVVVKPPAATGRR